jgi:hypothetical protein
VFDAVKGGPSFMKAGRGSRPVPPRRGGPSDAVTDAVPILPGGGTHRRGVPT